jgi:hypothetical protein
MWPAEDSSGDFTNRMATKRGHREIRKETPAIDGTMPTTRRQYARSCESSVYRQTLPHQHPRKWRKRMSRTGNF